MFRLGRYFLLIEAATAAVGTVTLERVEDDARHPLQNSALFQSVARKLQMFDATAQQTMDMEMGMDLGAMAVEFGCTFLMAQDFHDCVDNHDGLDCVWCPFGSVAGACFSPDQGAEFAEIGFPHLQCVDDETQIKQEDLEFWDVEFGCGMQSVTEDKCLGEGGSACTWCVVDDPAFALCMSSDFMDALEEFQPADDEIRLDQVVTCSKEKSVPAEGEEPAYGLLDPACFLIGMVAPSSCASVKDAGDRDCVPIADNQFCITETQKGVIAWYLQMMQDLGVDWGMFDQLLPAEVIESLQNDFGVDIEAPAPGADMQIGVPGEGSFQFDVPEGVQVPVAELELEEAAEEETEDEEGSE